jgi:hypothetical protein
LIFILNNVKIIITQSKKPYQRKLNMSSSLTPYNCTSNFTDTSDAYYAGQSYDQLASSQENNSPIDRSIPGNRLVLLANGTLQVVPKTPIELIGEFVLRPAIDLTWYALKGTYNTVQNAASSVFNFPPGAAAESIKIKIDELSNRCKPGDFCEYNSESLYMVVDNPNPWEDSDLPEYNAPKFELVDVVDWDKTNTIESPKDSELPAPKSVRHSLMAGSLTDFHTIPFHEYNDMNDMPEELVLDLNDLPAESKIDSIDSLKEVSDLSESNAPGFQSEDDNDEMDS